MDEVSGPCEGVWDLGFEADRGWTECEAAISQRLLELRLEGLDWAAVMELCGDLYHAGYVEGARRKFRAGEGSMSDG